MVRRGELAPQERQSDVTAAARVRDRRCDDDEPWIVASPQYNTGMPYPEFFVAPMRQELRDLGVRELRTAEEVDTAIANTRGTLMLVVNSVCGCAAGKARPGIALALRHGARPDAMASVFAGFDVAATDRARTYFTGYPPSSPSIALLRNGEIVYMLQRSDIETRDAVTIAEKLTEAFDRFCAAPTPQG